MILGNYLYEFVTVAKRQNMAQAALDLGMSTSALARHMAALESQLQANLLERTAAGVRLTEDGRYALSIATKIVEVADGLEASLREQ